MLWYIVVMQALDGTADGRDASLVAGTCVVWFACHQLGTWSFEIIADLASGLKERRSGETPPGMLTDQPRVCDAGVSVRLIPERRVLTAQKRERTAPQARELGAVLAVQSRGRCRFAQRLGVCGLVAWALAWLGGLG